MASGQLNGVLFKGLATESGERTKSKFKKGSFPEKLSVRAHGLFLANNHKRLRFATDAVANYSSVLSDHSRMMSCPSVIHKRKRVSSTTKGRINSDCRVQSSEPENRVVKEENDVSNMREIYPDLMGVGSNEEPKITEISRSKNIKNELIALSIPALAGQAIEPMAQLMETAYIGRLGPVQLASAGVSISIFNIVSKLFNIPLLSVATSFVAEDIAKNSRENTEQANGKIERQQLASVSTALLLAVGIGLFEGLALYLGSGTFLNLMGISSASSMHGPAQQFLSLRALGAPAVVVSLALQGIFRGFKDTKTPVVCLGIGNCLAIFLFPLLMYYFKLGVSGAAISTVISQYIVTFIMLWHLNKRAIILPPRPGALQFGGYMKSGGFLIGRTLAVLITTTLATSMAARQGPIAMAAHQICLQVWLAVSLITDALAASGQALIASSVSEGDYKSVKDITYFVLKIGFVMGVTLAAILGLSFGSLSTLFTKDIEVLTIARTGVLFVSASQPLNALAFIVDGLHYGVSDFPYAAYSMMLVGVISSAFLLYAPSAFGLYGVWSGLTIFMGLRMVAGFIRLSTKNGPWWFLHQDLNKAKVSPVG
ncbi:putative multi antimicrobial extrusion protein [Helianthus annuus]|nr:putative multi antimicrobial extrusion protein [Helianthus annuus]KAJ0867135.1 putative multi antimicrobial extrusion protein [Helianthus annuus]